MQSIPRFMSLSRDFSILGRISINLSPVPSCAAGRTLTSSFSTVTNERGVRHIPTAAVPAKGKRSSLWSPLLSFAMQAAFFAVAILPYSPPPTTKPMHTLDTGSISVSLAVTTGSPMTVLTSTIFFIWSMELSIIFSIGCILSSSLFFIVFI